MLNTMRRISDNIFVKAVFVMIIVSFVVWGIGDNFKSKRDILVAIGNEFISIQEFKTAKQRKLEELQSLLGVNLTDEQIKALAVDQMVLGQLVDHKLIELEAKELGLKISEQTVIDHIKQSPSFKNSEGVFDKELFKRIISSNGLSEVDFVDLINKEIIATNLITSLTSAKIVPNILVEYMAKYQKQSRVVEVIKIGDQPVANTFEPSDVVLEKYFNENKQKYFAPERRNIVYLELNNAHLQSKIQISEQELKSEFDANPSDFYSEEKRDIYNLFYQSEQEAVKSRNELHDSKKLTETIFKLSKKNPADNLLKDVSKASLPEELRELGFSIEQDQVSELIKSPLGFHILIVAKIYPSQPKAFADVRAQISKLLGERKFEQLIYETSQNFEDELAGGASLEEIASKFQLQLHKVSGIDAKGEDELGKRNNNLPNDANFMTTLFATTEKDNSPLTNKVDSGGYFVIRVDKVKTSEQMDFVAAKSRVVIDYKKAKANEEKKQFAESLLARVKAGEKMSILANENHLTYLADLQINHSDVESNENKLPVTLISELFTLKAKEVSKLTSDGDFNYVFGMVKKINHPVSNLGKEETARLNAELAAKAAHDIYQQYLTYLRKKYKVNQVAPAEDREK